MHAGDSAAATRTSVPWRVVLDIGREPLSTMPFDWARSGGRMPIVIPCNFEQRRKDEGEKDPSTKFRLVLPRSDTVSFTGPDGAVVRPIAGGDWKLGRDEKELRFTLNFPEALERRDVRIGAGTTIECTGRVFTKTELDTLNEDFYESRRKAWEVGGELNEISGRQAAPKKWNFETQRWEKRYADAKPIEWVQKRIKYAAAKAEQDRKNSRRPNQNALSGLGWLPGVEDPMFVSKDQGVVRRANDGALLGRWSMEPILDKPVSFYTK